MTVLLKKKNIKMTGHREISSSAVGAKVTKEVPKAHASVIAQEDGFVVIQVVCGCGQEIQLRCAYGGPQPAAQAAPAAPVPQQPA